MQIQLARSMAALVALLTFGAMASPASAGAAGTPDPTFGGTGVVTTDVSNSNDRANASVLQPDGKLVAAGTCTFTSADFCLARYNSDGTLDTTFDTDGKVTTDVTTADDQAHALALQPDGKLVAAGQCGVFPNLVFCLARYNANGSLDDTFGVNGSVTTDVSGAADAAYAVVVQSDGKLVAAGHCGDDFCIARYGANGSLDVLGFGAGTGTVITSISGGADIARALALQPDGNVIAAGRCEFATADFCLARYNGDGSLDTSFGIGGKAHTDINGDTNAAFALALQPDGKVVAAGDCQFASSDFCLARYNSNGTLDTAFGTGGIVNTDVGSDFDAAQSLVVQPDGKLVAAGICDSPTPDFCVARYNADGTPDTTFGTGGTTITDVSGDFDSAQALALQTDGKLVAAGYCDDPADLCVVRYDVSTTDKLSALAAQVTTLQVQAGIGNALSAKLTAVSDALASGKVNVSCNTLGAFTHQISAQSGKQIAVADATQALATALQIRTELACK